VGAQRYDVVGVGNAIVDVIARTDDAFVARHGLTKGSMTLIDAERAVELYDLMPPGVEASGGSAANTMAGVASLGGRAAYVGKVRADQLGEVFRHDLRAMGVGYELPLAPDGPPTARCLIVVTPDAERTMNTFLGISSLLEPDDVDEELCADAAVVYCEGYLWDVGSAKAAIRKAMAAAKAAGNKVALTLSDPFCVERHRAEFLELAEQYVDLLFANRAEMCALYEVDDVEEAVDRVRRHCEVAAVTLSARGSLVVTAEERYEVPAWSTGTVVDTTGAGDQYAAGFLAGFARGASLERCGRLGSLAAGEVISHLGPRPQRSLAVLAGDHALV
jgi:sugar/nucleoside kinase (ribokinase family)